MALALQRWRKNNRLTQVDAARLLGVSQTYLSLLEKGARPLTEQLRMRLKAIDRETPVADGTDDFPGQLSTLGYPGFAHVPPSRSNVTAEAFLVSVLSRDNVDARVVDALPWVIRRHADRLDLAWLVRYAKLHDLQNRLGFLLQTSGVETAAVAAAVSELDRARLLREDTLCWDSMPVATRRWMRSHRSPLAEHWNVVTRMEPESGYVG